MHHRIQVKWEPNHSPPDVELITTEMCTRRRSERVNEWAELRFSPTETILTSRPKKVWRAWPWPRPASFSMAELMKHSTRSLLLHLCNFFLHPTSHNLQTSTYIALHISIGLSTILALPWSSKYCNVPQFSTLHGLFALTAHCKSSSS